MQYLPFLFVLISLVAVFQPLHSKMTQSDDDRAVAEMIHEITRMVDPTRVVLKQATIEGRRTLIVGEQHNEQFQAPKLALQTRCYKSQDCLFFAEGLLRADTAENDYRKLFMHYLSLLEPNHHLEPSIPIFGLEEGYLLKELVFKAFLLKGKWEGFGDEKSLRDKSVVDFAYHLYQYPASRDFFSSFASEAESKFSDLIAHVNLLVDLIPQSSSGIFTTTYLSKWQQVFADEGHRARWADLFDAMAKRALTTAVLPTDHIEKLNAWLEYPHDKELQRFFITTFVLEMRNQAFARSVRGVVSQWPKHLPAIIWVGKGHVEGLHALLDDSALVTIHDDL